MPIYQYECACGQVLDITHGMFEELDIECDNCDGMMQKVFGVSAVHFKGSGFYSTDKN